jgi:membrane complex biogenesis BtpA family protein
MRPFRDTFGSGSVCVGMVHLAPLPGSPGYAGALSQVIDRAVREAQLIEKAGLGAVIVENYGDLPFLKQQVGPETVASMAIVAREIKQAARIPVGINVLRNDYEAALAVAAVTRCEFVRINILTGVFVTPEGILEGSPGRALRLRRRLAPDTMIFADVMVKHAYPIGAVSLGENALDVVERGGADCLIVTGPRTGSAPSEEDLRVVRSRLDESGVKVPLLVGSGVTPSNAVDFLKFSDGFIVGSYIREDGRAGGAVDFERARRIGDICKEGAD